MCRELSEEETLDNIKNLYNILVGVIGCGKWVCSVAEHSIGIEFLTFDTDDTLEPFALRRLDTKSVYPDFSAFHYLDGKLMSRYRIEEMIDLSTEIAERCVVVKVMQVDMKYDDLPEDTYEIIFADKALQAFNIKKLIYTIEKLEEICRKATDLWKMIGVSEFGDELREESNIDDNRDYHCIRLFIASVIDLYNELHDDSKSERLSSYKEYVLKSLDKFSKGKDLDEFSFSIVEEGEDWKHYLDFSSDGDSLNITDGGYVYDPAVGGDSYTNWMYTLWNSGESSGELPMRTREPQEFLAVESRLLIDSPYEYAYDEEDDEEEE